MKQRKSFLLQFLDDWGFWAVFSLFVVVWTLVWAYSDSLSARHLSEEGAEAQATVISLYETTRRSGRGTRQLCHVGLTFVVGDNTVLAEKTVPESFYSSMRTGMVIPILYWTGDPTLIEVQPGSFSEHARQLYILAVIAAAFTLLLGGPALHRTLSARWMVRHGVRRRVNVIALVDCGIPIQRKRWQLVWRDPSGSRVESRFHYITDLPPVGSTISILTDPTGRRSSIWQRDL